MESYGRVVSYEGDNLLGRIAPTPERFLQRVRESDFQDCCPWGDLTNMTSDRLVVPLALEIGAGGYEIWPPIDQLSLAGVTLEHVIASNLRRPQIFHPSIVANLKMDATKPEDINLAGARVHCIFARNVFTNDRVGLIWPSSQARTEGTRALGNLLVPGGIICLMGLLNRDLDWEVLKNEFGTKPFLIPGKANGGVSMWQIGHF
ncbi:MAG: hypothetical protein UT55_C0005G0008 [Candidatus Peregrinibacteria bacterium GW2011_GWE2_39_6]|nr:MAG: hypothetical protein UT36_C0011G0024 [Candidatus Peregrinibacteria bacterium GW2011_GWF2_39_17]KKR26595.1 MAG: hypothetical protein UT55_C0005G0008 [Candidatus Peregrinibacteria bacterium GW2011_GWE2_39_6]HCW32501.1 hypothetical protein [Candidatus Peregrinibacteria bacterium]